MSYYRHLTYTYFGLNWKVRADAINGRCQLIGRTVPYAATLQSWMPDSSTAGDKRGDNRQVYANMNSFKSLFLKKKLSVINLIVIKLRNKLRV